MEFICKIQYLDVLIIHLIHFFSLDPYHIYSLRYEVILSKNLIQYWDYKSKKNKIYYLYFEPWSDINIAKIFMEAVDVGDIAKWRQKLI